MKLIRRSIAKDESGSLTLLPEDSEDMWFVYNLLQEGDEVETKTMRKIVPLGRDGTPSGPGVRKLLKLRVRATKIDFDPEASILRLNGPVVTDVPDVSAGTFHTIQLEVDRNFELFKDLWDSYALQVVQDATLFENKSDIAAVVLQPGLAHVCLVTEAITSVRAKIETNIPKKRRGDNSGQDKAMEKFIKTTYEAFVRNINLEKVKVVLLAGPGQLPRDLYNYIFQQAVVDNKTVLVKSKSKFMVTTAASGHVHALEEVLRHEDVLRQLHHTRYGLEAAALDKFFKELNDDTMRAWYGPKQVEAAAAMGAIDTLLLTDTLFRSTDLAERRRYVALVEEIQEMGRRVLIFSSFHTTGEQLDSVTGIACITTYPVPELEDLSDDNASDSD